MAAKRRSSPRFLSTRTTCGGARPAAHIAFSAEVYPDADMAATAKRDKAKADDPVKAMKFDRLFIRHWDTWEDGKRSHLFALPVKQDRTRRAGKRPASQST